MLITYGGSLISLGGVDLDFAVDLRFGSKTHPEGGLRFGSPTYVKINAATDSAGALTAKTASVPAGSATGAVNIVSTLPAATASAPAGSAGLLISGGIGTVTASTPAGSATGVNVTQATGTGVTVSASAPYGSFGLRFGSQAYQFGGLRFGNQLYNPLSPYAAGTGAGVTVNSAAPSGSAIGYIVVTLAPPFDFSAGSILYPFIFDSTLGAPKAGDTIRYPYNAGLTIFPDGHGLTASNNITYTAYYNDGSGEVPFQIIVTPDAFAYGFGSTATTSAPVGNAVGPSIAVGTGVTVTPSAPSATAGGGVLVVAAGVTATASAPLGSVAGFTAATGTGVTDAAIAPTGSASAFAVANATGAGATATTSPPTGAAAVPVTASGAGVTVTATSPAATVSVIGTAIGAGVVAQTFAPTGSVQIAATATGAGVTATAIAPAGAATTAISASATGGGVVVASIVPQGSAYGDVDISAPMAQVLTLAMLGTATGGVTSRFRGGRIDVTELMTDPDFTSLDLVCERNTQTVSNQGLAVNSARQYGFAGVVTNDKGDVLQRGTDGSRVTGNINIHTRFRLSDGGAALDADNVLWGGRRYVVANVLDWSHFGRGFVNAECQLLDLTG